MENQAEAPKSVTIEKKSTDDDELRSYASSPCYQHELEPQFQEQGKADDWASVRHWRAQQRKQLLERRRSLDGRELSRAGAAITSSLEKEPRLVKDSVAFYWPLEGEVDLRPFMRALLARGVGVALPVIVEMNSPLEFWAWDESTPMQTNAVRNIPIPAERTVTSPAIIFVPLLGFDEQGHRLGHGGGYYDRTFADVDPRPLAVGIGHGFSRMTSIYPQSHDIPMDATVTDKGVIWYKQ